MPGCHHPGSTSILTTGAEASHNELETEEVMAYCEALDVNMGSYEYFVLADIVQAQSFGQITRQGFVKGWKQVYEDTGKRVTPDMAAHSKYVRAQIDRLRTDAALFGRVYRTAFTTGKELGKREMGMTEALAYWEELFKPAMGGWRTERVDWLGAWTAYLREKFGTETDGDWEYSRSVSRDLWNQTRLFAAKTMEDETLGFWSEEQAWPGLIDEFVVWCREKGKVPAQNGEAMEVEE